jgi:hypothetical protein
VDHIGIVIKDPQNIVRLFENLSLTVSERKKIEVLLNSRLNIRAPVNLEPERSLPQFEMKAQLIKKL